LFARFGAFLLRNVSGEISPHHQQVFDIIKKGEIEHAYCFSLCFDDV